MERIISAAGLRLKSRSLSSLRKRGAVSDSKTKYLLPTAKDSIGVCVEIHGYNFEVVKDFVYLGPSINADNDNSLEIRRRSTLANRCYFGLRKQLNKTVLSWRTKICLYI